VQPAQNLSQVKRISRYFLGKQHEDVFQEHSGTAKKKNRKKLQPTIQDNKGK
jgi:hypothetical protein